MSLKRVGVALNITAIVSSFTSWFSGHLPGVACWKSNFDCIECDAYHWADRYNRNQSSKQVRTAAIDLTGFIRQCSVSCQSMKEIQLFISWSRPWETCPLYLNIYFKKFWQKWTGWPSGQRCRLAIVGNRVRSQPKSKLFFFQRNQVSKNTLLVILN